MIKKISGLVFNTSYKNSGLFKLLTSFSIYTFSNVLNKGISFLLLPFFTHYLSAEDFGILSLITTLTAVLVPFTMLGTSGAIRLQYYKLEKEKFSQYVSNTLFIPLVVSVVFFLVCLLGNVYLSDWLKVPSFLILLIPFIAFLQVIPTIMEGLYQVYEEPKKFAVFSVSSATLGIVLGLLFVVSLNYGYKGRLFGSVAAEFLFCCITLYIIHKRFGLHHRLDASNIKFSLKYGLPLVPHAFGALVINFSDRFFISEMVSIGDLGIYSVAYTLGGIISIIQQAFVLGYTPFLYSSLSKKDFESMENKIKIVRFSYLIIFALILTVAILLLFTPYIYREFIDIRFHEGMAYVSWVAIGFFFLGTYKIFAGFIFYFNKTYLLTYLAVVNVVTNLIFNYFFIKTFGVIGAAYATALSYLIMFLITFIISNRLFPLPWFNKSIFKI